MEKKEEPCGVVGCKKPAVKSLPTKKFALLGVAIKEEKKRIHICKEHYKQYKKKTKKERELEMLGWSEK
jgi:hypothetical protein